MAQLVARLNGIQKVRGSNPLGSTKKYRTYRTIFFCLRQGIPHDFIVVLPCNKNPCGLITNEERRKRVAFADIECSLIANKSDTKCPRKA